VRPAVARVTFSKTFTGSAVGLAREARRDNIHESTPWERVEGGSVIPHRTRAQLRFFQPFHEGGCGVSLPFDSANGAIFGQYEVQGGFKPSIPGV
jgi:hypothetical protein